MKKPIYYYTPDVYRRVLSTFMEPSYFSTFITGMFFYVLYRKNHIKNANKLLVFILFELILTFSSTGYLIIVSVGVFFAFYINDRKLRNIFLFFSLVIAFYLIFVDTTILDEVIFDKMDSDSGRERDNWNIIAMEYFFENPITGIGYKEWRASSFAISLLCENGIIGAVIYFFFYFALFLPLFNQEIKCYCSQEIASRFFVLCVVLGQIIACPDIELCTMWLGFYFVMLSINKKDEQYYINSYSNK